jgi:hypothetical protein
VNYLSKSMSMREESADEKNLHAKEDNERSFRERMERIEREVAEKKKMYLRSSST